MAKKKKSRREELERRAREIGSRVKTVAVKTGRAATPHIKRGARVAGRATVSGARAAGRFAAEEFRLQREARRESAREHRREARRYGRRARRGVVADPLGTASIGRMMGTARPRPPTGRRVSRTRPRSKKKSKQKYIIRNGVAYPVRQRRTTRRPARRTRR